jgi:hypothetical protein
VHVCFLRAFFLAFALRLLGGRTNSLCGARSKGNGVITDEVYTYNGSIIISTYGRCKSRPLWGCREVSPRGPPRGSLTKVATRHVTAISPTPNSTLLFRSFQFNCIVIIIVIIINNIIIIIITMRHIIARYDPTAFRLDSNLLPS